jgi:hypothetical protein
MNYKEKFEDDGFIYELTVQATDEQREDLFTYSQGSGYCCGWIITGKQNNLTRELSVTNDDCEVIVYHTVEAAVKGAKDFLSI